MFDEGYIKFICRWEKSNLPENFNAKELLQTRDKIFEMGLIGYDAKEKVGFGNISQRYHKNEFIISGTQTGHLKNLSTENLSWIKTFDIEKNAVDCGGPAKASSESLTHASIYKNLPGINAVIHIHSERLWTCYLNKIPATKTEVPYGTPEMAYEVNRLIKEENLEQKKIFAMAGHKDGIVCFGNSLREAFEILNRIV